MSEGSEAVSGRTNLFVWQRTFRLFVARGEADDDNVVERLHG